MIKWLNCCNAESPHLSNRAVSCRNARMNQAHCDHCATADPTDALVAAIAAHPRNRTGRQRTSPRTKAQRRTERTRNVTYTIDIVSSNLPIAA
jgi:hypothetical protein